MLTCDRSAPTVGYLLKIVVLNLELRQKKRWRRLPKKYNAQQKQTCFLGNPVLCGETPASLQLLAYLLLLQLFSIYNIWEKEELTLN